MCSIKGDVLPIGGVNAKIKAAVDAGLKTVIIPYDNKRDVILDEKMKKKIKIKPVKRIEEVIKLTIDKKFSIKKYLELPTSEKKCIGTQVPTIP